MKLAAFDLERHTAHSSLQHARNLIPPQPLLVAAAPSLFTYLYAEEVPLAALDFTAARFPRLPNLDRVCARP